MATEYNLKDKFIHAFNNKDHAIDNSFCAWCNSKVVATEFHDELSMKDYSITGLCMDCQNKTYRKI